MSPGKRRRPVAPTQRPPLPKPARSVPKGSVAMVFQVNVCLCNRSTRSGASQSAQQGPDWVRGGISRFSRFPGYVRLPDATAVD